MTALLAALLLLTACQPTPEAAVVVQKDFDQLKEKAKMDGNRAPGLSLSASLKAPETLNEAIESHKENVKVYVEAEVTVPDAVGIPLMRVSHGSFTREDMRRFADVLFQGAMPLDPNNTKRTKKMIQASIDWLMKMRESGELDMQHESVEQVDAAIAELMTKLDAAPDTMSITEHDFQQELPFSLRATDDFVTISDIFCQEQKIEYCKNLNRYAAMSLVLVGTPDSSPLIEIKPDMSAETGYTPEEAYALATETVNRLNIKDLACNGQRAYFLTEGGFGVYEFMFTRMVNKIPTTFTNDSGNEFNPNSVHVPWEYEKLRLFIDETGVCYLEYTSPYSIDETVSEQTNLLSFDEVWQIAEVMLPIVNDKFNDYDTTININSVKLGFMRILEEGYSNSGLLVPVWDFMGSSSLRHSSNGTTQEMDDPYTSYLTVNAIDGSIISRALGY